MTPRTKKACIPCGSFPIPSSRSSLAPTLEIEVALNLSIAMRLVFSVSACIWVASNIAVVENILLGGTLIHALASHSASECALLVWQPSSMMHVTPTRNVRRVVVLPLRQFSGRQAGAGGIAQGGEVSDGEVVFLSVGDFVHHPVRAVGFALCHNTRESAVLPNYMRCPRFRPHLEPGWLCPGTPARDDPGEALDLSAALSDHFWKLELITRKFSAASVTPTHTRGPAQPVCRRSDKTSSRLPKITNTNSPSWEC